MEIEDSDQAQVTKFKEKDQNSSNIDRKREKIRSNYETIAVLKSRLGENKRLVRSSMTRSDYLKMIFDVTKKVEKQNLELSRAISDTRQMQRDINNLNGRLDRSFALVKDMIAKVSWFVLIKSIYLQFAVESLI